MSSLTEALLSQAALGTLALDRAFTEFSPADIRQTIAELVAKDQISLANAVSDAGLSLYPESEDILAISGLLAEIQSEWAQAEQMLLKLIEVQGSATSAMAWRHLIRVQRCHCEPGLALASAELAVAAHPHDQDLALELSDLRSIVAEQTLMAAPALTQ